MQISLLGNKDGYLKDYFFKKNNNIASLTQAEYQLYKNLSKRILQYQYIKLPNEYSGKTMSPIAFDSLFQTNISVSKAGYVTHVWPKRIAGKKESLILNTLKLDSISPVFTKDNSKYVIKIKREVKDENPRARIITLKDIQELVINKELSDKYQLYTDSIINNSFYTIDTIAINLVMQELSEYQNNYRLSCNEYIKSIGSKIIAKYSFDEKQYNINVNELFSNINRWRLEYKLISTDDITKECQQLLVNSILNMQAIKLNLNEVSGYKTDYKLANIKLLPKITINTAIENKVTSNPELVKQYYKNNIQDFPCAEEVEIALLYFKSKEDTYRAYSKHGYNLFSNALLQVKGLSKPVQNITIDGECSLFNQGFIGRVLSDSIGTVKIYNNGPNQVALLKIRKGKGKRLLKFTEFEREIVRRYRKYERIMLEEKFLNNFLL